MLYNLPNNCLTLIYEYDPTYMYLYNLVLLELLLHFKHSRILRGVIMTFHNEILLFKFYVNENIRVLIK